MHAIDEYKDGYNFKDNYDIVNENKRETSTSLKKGEFDPL